jgi:hypothetical protein
VLPSSQTLHFALNAVSEVRGVRTPLLHSMKYPHSGQELEHHHAGEEAKE